MIDPTLFLEPLALDRMQHRHMRLKPSATRYDRTAAMNALFITAVEFGDVCREFPIVFVEAGQQNGQRDIAPMAVLGLEQGENLVLGADGSWGARYTPVILQSYPMGLAKFDDGNYALCVDAKSGALSTEEGERLFNDEGEPTPFLDEIRKFVEQIESEAERTRLVGRRLIELDLLRAMRFDATLPDGKQITVDGFLALDEEKFAALSDAVVIDLHRNGLLAIIHAHQISLGLMRALVERRLARQAAA